MKRFMLIFVFNCLSTVFLNARSFPSCDHRGPDWDVCKLKNSSVLLKFIPEVSRLWEDKIDERTGSPYTIRLVLKNLTIHSEDPQELGTVNFTDGTFENLPMMLGVMLEDVQLLGPSPFKGDKYLKDIRLVNNKLDKFPQEFFEGIPNLLVLTIENQQIEEISNTSFSQVTSSLEVLNFERNQLRVIGPRCFSKLTNLKVLNLAHNRLPFLRINMLEGLRNLEILQLHHNGLHAVGKLRLPNDLSLLGDLKILNLGYNNLHAARPEMFAGLSRLEILRLNSNKIQGILPETFNELPNLRELFLHNNKFITFPEEVFDKLLKLEILEFNENVKPDSLSILQRLNEIKKKKEQTSWQIHLHNWTDHSVFIL